MRVLTLCVAMLALAQPLFPQKAERGNVPLVRMPPPKPQPSLLDRARKAAQKRAASESKDGNDLLDGCTQAIRLMNEDSLNPAQGMRGALCLGYIGGFLGSHMLIVSLAESQPLFCTPKVGLKRRGVQVGQAARIIVKWLTDHPKDLHLDVDILTLLALADAFPCPEPALESQVE